jgi:outer membrane protein insertion porin family
MKPPRPVAVALALAALLASGVAAADAVEAEVARAAEVADDPTFGPEITIEAIRIVGNERTAERLIRRVLLVEEGQTLRAGDPRLRDSRFRVLALGWFYDVQLALDRGSARGKVVLTVRVTERGTATLHRVFLGTSEVTPVWAGFDVGDSNFLGSGVLLRGAFAYVAPMDLPGAESQLALRLRYGDPSLLGRPLGAHAQFLYNRGSEPWPDGAGGFDVIRHTRVGGTAGVSFDLSRLARVILDARVENVDLADDAPVPEPRGTLVSAAVGLERDTRPDPVLPFTGKREAIVVEAGRLPGGAPFDWVRIEGGYSRWFPVAGMSHVISVHGRGGVIFGEPPFFDRFAIGEWNKLLPAPVLDLWVSTRGSRDLFRSGIDEILRGNVAVAGEIEYAHRLFRRAGPFYGGDLYLGVGFFGLGQLGGLDRGLPLGLTLDAGLRLDTAVGIFELGLANAIGRVPF